MMVRDYAPSAPAYVAVNAAASAIGQMIIRMLNHAGLRPIAIVRRPESMAHIEDQLAVQAVICTSEAGLRHTLCELTGGRGLTVAWDAVGGTDGDDLVRALHSCRTLVHYELLSGTPLSTGLLKSAQMCGLSCFG